MNNSRMGDNYRVFPKKGLRSITGEIQDLIYSFIRIIKSQQIHIEKYFYLIYKRTNKKYPYRIT